MRTTFVLVFIFFILIAGCNQKKDDLFVNPAPDIKGIVPITIGNQWTYKLFLYDTTGAIRYTTQSPLTVVGDTIINGFRWYKYSYFNDYKFSYYLCANKQNGFYALGDSGELLLFKYPAIAGDSFYVNSKLGYLHVLSADTMTTIGSVSYHCVAYESFKSVENNAVGGSHEILFVSPNIGPIKCEVYTSFYSWKKPYLYVYAELVAVNLN